MGNLLRWVYFNLAYLGRPRWDTRQSPPELLEFIRDHPAGSALDMGCGTGTNLVTLGKSGWRALGFDYSPLAIRIAARRISLESLHVSARVADVTALPPNLGLFDLVLDIGCYQNLDLPGKEAYRRQLERHLAPGGTWLLYFLKRTAEQPDLGLSEADIKAIGERFHIKRRVDGSDGKRSSAWLWVGLPITENR